MLPGAFFMPGQSRETGLMKIVLLVSCLLVVLVFLMAFSYFLAQFLVAGAASVSEHGSSPDGVCASASNRSTVTACRQSGSGMTPSSRTDFTGLRTAGS